MPLFDYLKIARDEIAPLLEPGEQPLAMTRFGLAYGSDRLERSREDREQELRFLHTKKERERIIAAEEAEKAGEPPPPARQPSAPEQLGVAVAGAAGFALGGDLGPGADIDFDKLLGGVSAVGRVGSYAYRLAHLDRSKSEGFRYCLATGRRLLVVESRGSGRARRFEQLIGIPRDAVKDAKVQWRGASRGRVLIAFTDSSAIALMTGMVGRARARQLVHALTHGAPAP